MVKGIKVSYQFLFPILKEEFLGKRVFKAIRNNEEVVCIPWLWESVYFLKYFLTVRGLDIFKDVLGANSSMEELTGRNY